MAEAAAMSSDLIAVAAMIVGFGTVVIMFRIQRELLIREHPAKYPNWPTWLACADGLILASVVMAVFLVVVPLLAFPTVTRCREALAAASCVSAVLLQFGYVPAILAHYRIGIVAQRTIARERGEPAEKVIVVLSIALAALAFAFVFCRHTV